MKPYLKEGVLLEFGARNVTTPNEIFSIRSFLHQLLPEDQISLPVAQVPVLSAERTFWEKATLIHIECTKTINKYPPYSIPFELPSVLRLSRHWYDLAMLFRNDVGKQAANNRKLLNEVVQHKKVFFTRKDYNYDACLNGSLRLIPNEEDLIKLEQDYEAMIENGMFWLYPK